MLACNGRFGASGAVARSKVCANLEVFACPNGSESPTCAKPLERSVQVATVRRDNV